jgi:CHAT domain-containing protein/Flp pilus assembly protein TadD
MNIQRFLKMLLLAVLLLLLGLGGCSEQSVSDRDRSLYWQIVKLKKQGRIAEAIPLAEQHLASKEQALGTDHLGLIKSLAVLAELYYHSGDSEAAEELYLRVLNIREDKLGPQHVDVAQSLSNLVMFYASGEKHVRAEALHQRALELKANLQGRQAPDDGFMLHDLAQIYSTLGHSAQAENLHLRALDVRQATLDPHHPAVADSLHELALFYSSLEDPARAQGLFEKALVIKEAALGADHPDLPELLNNLAMNYEKRGDYQKAKQLLTRALRILEQSVGPDHPEVAIVLQHLAGVYERSGDYARVEPLLKRSLAIRENAFGPDHPDVALSLNDLAGHYSFLAEYKRAERLYQRSLAILERSNPDHPMIKLIHVNLASVYRAQGRRVEAEILLKKSLALWEKQFGPEHPGVAPALNNLAALYTASGEIQKAEPLYARVLDILERSLGSDHPEVAVPLNNLAILYYFRGEYRTAEPYYRQALAINEKFYGPDHPLVIATLNNLAAVNAGMQDFEKAHSLHIQAARKEDRLIDHLFGFTTEDQKIRFLTNQNLNLHSHLSLVCQHLISREDARKDAFNYWLRRKGLVLEAQTSFQKALVNTDNPRQSEIYSELCQVRDSLVELAFSGPKLESSDAYRKRIFQLEQKKDDLEAALSRLDQTYSQNLKKVNIDLETVFRNLPKDSILLEFAKIRMFNYFSRDPSDSWFPAHYFVFLLSGGQTKNVKLIDLGQSSAIDKLITAFKRALSHPDDRQGLNADALSRQLYALLFDPIREKMGQPETVFISPDGNLNLIPFETLKGPDGRYLIEDYTFNYLNTGRDLLNFGNPARKASQCVIIGNPDYGLMQQSKMPSLTQPDGQSQQGPGPQTSPSQPDSFFGALPGVKKEVFAIWQILGKEEAVLYTGKQATEEILIQSVGPRILHIATHGFFLSDLQFQFLINDAYPFYGSNVAFDRSKEIVEFNPLLRSGIILAGANHSIKKGSSHGIVTAEEILGMNLRGTEMVVLSACDTGLGDIQAGEGVFGLRRAFSQVGAKSVVMSMWSVPDRETKELMIQFYQNLESGKNRCQALRQAALQQMQIVNQRYETTNPFYWGAFVFLGEP